MSRTGVFNSTLTKPDAPPGSDASFTTALAVGLASTMAWITASLAPAATRLSLSPLGPDYLKDPWLSAPRSRGVWLSQILGTGADVRKDQASLGLERDYWTWISDYFKSFYTPERGESSELF